MLNNVSKISKNSKKNYDDVPNLSYFPNFLIRLGLSTTLTSEDKNGDFVTSLKVKNKDCILMYSDLGAKIENISTNEVIYPINHYFAS